jgi:hypothetical protein
MAAIGTKGADTPVANMSPQPPRDDDPDFLDDFVLEDAPELAQEQESAEDGLEELFAVPPDTVLPEPGGIEPAAITPVAPPAGAPAARAAAAASGAEDPEDLLFEDHTQRVVASERFAEPVGFVENAENTWQGAELELDEPAAAKPAPAADEPDEFALEAEQEADWEIDAEQELELVGADEAPPATAGDAFPAAAFTTEELLQQMAGVGGQEDTDDGLLSEVAAELQDAEPSEDAEAPVADAELDDQALVLMEEDAASWAAEATNESPVAAGAAPEAFAWEPVEDAAPIEPGWEPLPAAQMDDLAEVAEVGVPELAEEASTPVAWDDHDEAEDQNQPEEAANAEALAPVLAGPSTWRAAAAASAGVDEEIYQSHEVQEAAVVGGAQVGRRRRRAAGLVAAAGLCLAAAAAAYGLAPAWSGSADEPEAVVVVQVPRPSLQVAVAPPPLPEPKTETVLRVAQPEPVPAPPEPVASQPVVSQPVVVAAAPTPTTEVPAVEPTHAVPVATAPDVPEVPVVPVEPAVPVAGTQPTPERPTPAVPANENPAPAAIGPVVTAPSPSAPPAPEPVAEAQPTAHWPVARQTPETRRNGTTPTRIRIGEGDALVAEEPPAASNNQPVDGVLPGARALAQLQNGNYFIGNVKQIDASQVTLRLGSGEITLVRSELTKLLPLGTADYEALQKVNSGSVRLTNRNRLVGSILSDIADDYVVLEFRSNRVMLPKAAVGEVVQGDGEAVLRLATTVEEDDWLRRLVERQLGTGLPAAPPGGSVR